MGIEIVFFRAVGAFLNEASDFPREFEPKGAGEFRREAVISSGVPLSLRIADSVLGLKTDEAVVPYVARFPIP